MNLLSPDPSLTQERPEPHVYRCRKCRRIVASKSNLITHMLKDQEYVYESPLQRRKEKPQLVQKFLHHEHGAATSTDIDEVTEKLMATTIGGKSLAGKYQETQPQICTRMFFVEPMTWMKDVVNNVEGKLYCPNCQSKIGSFNWIMASKCHCGEQVSPSFYLVPSKIEYSNVVQNMQITV